jgi:hypothetical protein
MNKKVWIGFGVVFVVLSILDSIVNGVLLRSAYESTHQLWRSEADMKIWLFFVVYAFQAFFLSLLFSKGYEGKGVAEGARFGLYVGLLFAIPMAYGSYGAMPIPYSLALQWFFYGLVEFEIIGIVLALVFGKQAMVQKVTAA